MSILDLPWSHSTRYPGSMMNTALASLPSPWSITDAEAMPWAPIAPGYEPSGDVAYRRGCAS